MTHYHKVQLIPGHSQFHQQLRHYQHHYHKHLQVYLYQHFLDHYLVSLGNYPAIFRVAHGSSKGKQITDLLVNNPV